MNPGENKIAASDVKSNPSRNIPLWVSVLIPVLAIGLMLVLFAYGNPLSLFTANLPPIENLNLERIRVVEDGFEVTLVNGGPDPVTIAQVLVDDAYWNYQISPSSTLPRLGRAKVDIPYPWVENELRVVRCLRGDHTCRFRYAFLPCDEKDGSQMARSNIISDRWVVGIPAGGHTIGSPGNSK
jgi:hypothetical protein